jgi:hypothetical protein
LGREGSRLEAVIVSLAGDASSHKPVPKKIPMIAAAISPTETGKSRMPTVRAAGLVRRLGVETSAATAGFRPWFVNEAAFRGPKSGSARSFQKRRAS